MLAQTIAVAKKDLLIEWRSPARASGVFFFALAVLLVLAFATGASVSVLHKIAGGALWIGVLLASTRSLDHSFQVETEQGALEGLALWPVDGRAIYYGKALANTILLIGVSFALVVAIIALHDVTIRGSVPALLAFIVLGSAAIAAPGTLYALITGSARGASVLLPVLLFPLVVPALIASSRGVSLVFEGDPMGQAGAWLVLLGAFNAVHWSLSGLLFGRLLEDG